MQKGSGISAVDSHIRIPEALYEQLADRVKQTKCRSVNRMVVAILEDFFKQQKESESTLSS